jgi:hypothetical protein
MRVEIRIGCTPRMAGSSFRHLEDLRMKFHGESFVIDLDAAREGLRTKIGLVGLTLPEAKSCAVF